MTSPASTREVELQGRLLPQILRGRKIQRITVRAAYQEQKLLGMSVDGNNCHTIARSSEQAGVRGRNSWEL